MPHRLVDRSPELDRTHLIGSFVPPPMFSRVSFDTFRPDSDHPSQAEAVARLREFRPNPPSRRRRLGRRARAQASTAGVYLDGGFGVGKTHLLASLWHASRGPKAFGTFVEYTHLVGALGFRAAAGALGGHVLVCIDEFELDDPGDTVLMSTLLGELVTSGVRLAATSNTLPDRLGEGRFAADDFLREIQGLRSHFDVIRIEGEDYRHRGLPPAAEPLTPAALSRRLADRPADAVTVTDDDFTALLGHLAAVHPSRYGTMVDGVDLVVLRDLVPLPDQAAALRLVVLIDRLYDRGVPVWFTGVALDDLFPPDMLAGGYRKKYHRALSRLVALSRT